MKTKERIILLLLAALNFTHILDFMIMMPLGNFLMPHFNINTQQFSSVVAAYTFSAGITGFFAAFFADSFDRKKILLFGFIGFLIGTLCCALAPTYGLLFAARIVAGAFGGLIGAQVLSIVADLVPYERRASAMATIMSAFSVSSIFGVPFSLYLSSHFSWHTPFYFIAGLGVVLIPLLIRFIPKMDKHLNEDGPKISPLELVRGVVSDPNQVMALLLSGIIMMGHFLIVPFLNPYLEFNMGFSSKTQTPLMYLVGGSLTLVCSPIIGRIADRTGKFKLFTIMVLLGVFPIAFITNMPHIPFYFVLCVTGFWFIVSSGRSIPAQAMVSNVVPPERRGSFMSFNSSIQQLFVGSSSLIAGFIVHKTADNKIENYNLTGYLSIVLILSSILIAWRLNKTMERRKKESLKEVQKEAQ
ncbi:MAG: MFS transporter [Sphingobacteriales bacterium]|nr:MAG: MFS transporter [Sphingobacteriales bacterium]